MADEIDAPSPDGAERVVRGDQKDTLGRIDRAGSIDLDRARRKDMKPKTILFMAALGLSVSLLLISCGGSTAQQTAAPTPTSGVGVTAETSEPQATSALEGDRDQEAPGSAGLMETAVTRAPEPTATPGPVTEVVTEFTTSAGLTSDAFLGLSADDWINLGISLLIVFIGYLAGTWLIRSLLSRAVSRTPTKVDDKLLTATGDDLRWLVVLLALDIATGRLAFLGTNLKSSLGDVYFIAALLLVLRLTWRLIDVADAAGREWAISEGSEEQLAPVFALLVRACRFTAVIAGASILLAHFGVDIAALTVVIGLFILAVALAARGTIADVIAGIIIFVDQPYRVGDRIEIESVGTWGDVVTIGLRSTHIVTRDNRMFVVPNSIIGTNQVINYSYPDPTYRVQTHVGIAYDADVETARLIITDTVRQVEGVMPDKPVEALFNEMGDSAMIFRVRWWLESYSDMRHSIDRVHTALKAALDAAGIQMPFPTQSVDLEIGQEAAERFSKAFREPG